MGSTQFGSGASGHRPGQRPEASWDSKDSRGDRRGQAQDGAGSVELWAMLAITPFRESTPNFSSLALICKIG